MDGTRLGRSPVSSHKPRDPATASTTPRPTPTPLTAFNFHFQPFVAPPPVPSLPKRYVSVPVSANYESSHRRHVSVLRYHALFSRPVEKANGFHKNIFSFRTWHTSLTRALHSHQQSDEFPSRPLSSGSSESGSSLETLICDSSAVDGTHGSRPASSGLPKHKSVTFHQRVTRRTVAPVRFHGDSVSEAEEALETGESDSDSDSDGETRHARDEDGDDHERLDALSRRIRASQASRRRQEDGQSLHRRSFSLPRGIMKRRGELSHATADSELNRLTVTARVWIQQSVSSALGGLRPCRGNDSLATLSGEQEEEGEEDEDRRLLLKLDVSRTETRLETLRMRLLAQLHTNLGTTQCDIVSARLFVHVSCGRRRKRSGGCDSSKWVRFDMEDEVEWRVRVGEVCGGREMSLFLDVKTG